MNCWGSYADNVYDADADNNSIYVASIKPLVDATLNGINATVFAYGQTASGKTHTMFGTDDDPGAVPRAMADILTAFETVNSSSVNHFSLHFFVVRRVDSYKNKQFMRHSLKFTMKTSLTCSTTDKN